MYVFMYTCMYARWCICNLCMLCVYVCTVGMPKFLQLSKFDRFASYFSRYSKFFVKYTYIYTYMYIKLLFINKLGRLWCSIKYVYLYYLRVANKNQRTRLIISSHLSRVLLHHRETFLRATFSLSFFLFSLN